VLGSTQSPPFASHSNSSALCPVARNLSDRQAKALADAGGIIGINFYKKFLRKKDWRKAGITDVADHIMHLCEVAGPQAVALGADYDGISHPAQGLENVAKLPALTKELLSRGVSKEQVKDIWYNNAVNYFKKVLH
jgi:membrane dipeptidase